MPKNNPINIYLVQLISCYFIILLLPDNFKHILLPRHLLFDKELKIIIIVN